MINFRERNQERNKKALFNIEFIVERILEFIVWRIIELEDRLNEEEVSDSENSDTLIQEAKKLKEKLEKLEKQEQEEEVLKAIEIQNKHSLVKDIDNPPFSDSVNYDVMEDPTYLKEELENNHRDNLLKAMHNNGKITPSQILRMLTHIN